MYTVLVCGDRNWENETAIYNALFGMPAGTTIVNGGCKGADNLSTKVAKSLRLSTSVHHANWKKHGKSAGPIRNQLMIDCTHPNLVIAFHSNIQESKGTRDMCKRARDNGIPVILITG